MILQPEHKAPDFVATVDGWGVRVYWCVSAYRVYVSLGDVVKIAPSKEFASPLEAGEFAGRIIKAMRPVLEQIQ
jgi:hypothetical protein